ncbi:hypothetical protein BGZ67_009827 [Mortierella alpina]|nr:hypothetical protein BGZ67_009827 [Mortierella alpina]
MKADSFIRDKDDQTGNHNLRKMRALYSSCMDEKQIESVGLRPLVNVAKMTINRFPVHGSPFAILQNLTALEIAGMAVMTRSSAIDRQALTRTLAYLSERGLDSLLSVGIPNATDPTKIVLRMQPNTDAWISPQYYSTSNDLGNNHLSAIEVFAQISHRLTTKENRDCKQPLPQGSIETQWTDFENLPWFRELQHAAPETVDIEWLKNTTRSIDWPLRLPTVFAVNSSRTINVEIARDVAAGFDEMFENHGSPLAVQGTVGERWKYCAGVLNTNLGRISGQFFVKKTFSREKQVAADEVAQPNESIVFVGHEGSLNNSLASKDLEGSYKD